MVSTATKIRLGVFLLIGLVLILVFVAIVAGNKLTQKWDTYYIEFQKQPVSGLQVGGTVNYQGVKVGQVQSIKIDPQDVEKIVVHINVEPGTPIKEDTEAVLALVGITGIKAVEIKGGSNQAANLKPGSQIKTGSTMLDDISDRALSIAEKLDLIANNIGEITGGQNQENIARILAETSLLLEDTRMNLGGTLASLNTIAENTAGVTAELGKNMDKLTDNLTANLDLISRSAVHSLDSLNVSLNNSLAQLTREGNLLLSDTRFQINRLGGQADSLVTSSAHSIASITTNINSSLDSINKLLGSPEFAHLIESISLLSGQLSEADFTAMITNFNSTILRTGTLVSNINRTILKNQDSIIETMENLRDATGNLNDFAKQIADDPSSMIRGN